MSERPLATLSMDLDDYWSYLRSVGDPAWQGYPSFLTAGLGYAHEVLARLGLHLTAFLIGMDADRPANHAALRALVAAGHEIGCHSYQHDPALALEGRAAIHAELARAEHSIAGVTGVQPRVYRGPSFSYSADLLEVLAERGYRVDASVFPTFLGPLARLYHRYVASAGAAPDPHAPGLFGDMREGLRPLRPFVWQLAAGELLEIPTTTHPGLRIPVHGTYLHFIADRSEALALSYWRSCLYWCRQRGIAPSFLLHMSDFLGHDDVPAGRAIPGMRRSGQQKRAFIQRVLGMLDQSFEVLPMLAFAERHRGTVGSRLIDAQPPRRPDDA